MANIKGVEVNIEFSTDGTSWKTLICETRNGIQLSRSTSETSTKCDGGAKKVSLGTLGWNFSFDAVADTAPTTNQVTYNDVLGWMHGGTKIYARVQSDATGADFYHKGQGYITDLSLTAETESDVQFSGTFTGSDALVIIPA